MSRNNHARTKEKKKKLRLKAFHKRVIEKRQQKLVKKHKPKGQMVIGDAIKVAVNLSYQGNKKYINDLKRPANGQRKRRKLVRQMNGYKKK